MWHFTFGDHSWSTDDLSLREIAELEGSLGLDWGELKPGHSMRHFLAISAVFLRRHHSEDEVVKTLDALDLGNLDDHLAWKSGDDLPDKWEDGLPLPGKGAPGTAGSSGASATTAGPLT